LPAVSDRSRARIETLSPALSLIFIFVTMMLFHAGTENDAFMPVIKLSLRPPVQDK
jgi:hypothetical protein